MRYIKICVFLILLNTRKIAYSMPALWGNKEKAEEYIRDRQGNTKEQGQGTNQDSNTNGSRSRN